ncbi:MAG: hypothetical protein V2I41_11645 [Pseudomonadales bacterium]|nr:hypothetical protein [Pseudomonadales bacterium]
MGIRVKSELRKINGIRFARFKLIDEVYTDSKEEALLTLALSECNITSSGSVGLFKDQVKTTDGRNVSRVGGVDIPLDAIKAFTTALNCKGFEVT